MNSKKSINSIKFVIFFILFIFIFFFFLKIGEAFIQDRKNTSRWYAYKQLPENSLDMLFMGNSHSFCSIDPTIVDDILNTNSFVLGISAESIITTYYELEEALKTQSPKFVVLELFVLDTTPTRNQYYFQDFFWNIENIFNLNSYIKEITNNSFDTILSLPAIYEHSYNWKNLYSFFITNKNNKNIYEVTKGFLPRETLTNELYDYQSFSNQYTSQPYQQNLIYFEKFLELCKKNDIELIIIDAPSLNDNWMKEDEIKIMNRDYIKDAIGKAIIYPQESYSNSILFTDEQHLSIIGATKFSIEIAEQLNNQYDFEFNLNKFNLYQESTISNISITPIENDSAILKIENFPKYQILNIFLIKKDGTTEKYINIEPMLNINNLSIISKFDIRIDNPKLNRSIRILLSNK